MGEFDKIMLERWEHIDDVVWRCKIHNVEFDIDMRPCPYCWLEYSASSFIKNEEFKKADESVPPRSAEVNLLSLIYERLEDMRHCIIDIETAVTNKED